MPGKLPPLPETLAERAIWWCAVNGHETPPGVPPCSNQEQEALYGALSAEPGVLKAGLALWRQRWDAGLLPQSGHPLPPSWQHARSATAVE